MGTTYFCSRVAAASLVAFGMAFAATPIASADPDETDSAASSDPAPADEPQQLPVGPAVSSQPVTTDDGNPAATDACKQFSAALNYAATNYEEFAYASAGNGNSVNYGDASVANYNVAGRTALRQAASEAMNAAMTPGLQPEVSAPMRTWSLRATKLVLVMGLRGGGDTLNSTATDLNTDARDVQMACALAGTTA
jgi:hypothetical protein